MRSGAGLGSLLGMAAGGAEVSEANDIQQTRRTTR
jgi:hypothetical protein